MPAVPSTRRHPLLAGAALHRLRRVLDQDGVIAYPTEGVWGLGCRPDSLTALQRVLEIKRRPAHKGLIVIASDPAQLASLIDWSALTLERVTEVLASWPGPVTWLLPAHHHVPYLLRGEHTTLAVRVSAHPLVQALCRNVGPLVSTSANHAGRRSALSALQVRSWFGKEVDLLVPGALGGRKGPSTIRDGLSGAVLR